MRHVSLKSMALYRKFLIGYFCLAAIPLMILALSVYKGAGWAGLAPGIPIYLTLLGAATYQFIKELRALKQEEGESEKSSQSDES